MDRRDVFRALGVGAAAQVLGSAYAYASPHGKPRGFPRGFLWGAASAAHQVEGQNINSDFWVLENLSPSPFSEPSGDACDSWNRHLGDVALAARLGLNAYRFSVEWARIEPERGAFSLAMLAYYRRLLEACRAHGLTPIVTYHHFTSPRWFAALGGWERADAVDDYVRYADRVTRTLGDLIGYACTFNEPNQPPLPFILRGNQRQPGEAAIQAMAAKRVGSDRFGCYGIGDPLAIRDAMLRAHARARDAIRAHQPSLPVGQTLALQALRAEPGGERLRDRIVAETRTPFYESAAKDDFVGVQTYLSQRVGPGGLLPPRADAPLNADGEDASFDSLEVSIREAAAACGRPILVTEHGINSRDDTQRVAVINAAVDSLHRLLSEGMQIRGYVHWSFLDNFEWLKGFKPTFGLVAVDRTTFERRPKPSARYLGRLARTNGAGRS